MFVCFHFVGFCFQMEVQAEEQAAEAQKEKKLRERNEQYSRQLEEELEGLKVTVEDSYAVLKESLHICKIPGEM